MNRNDELYQIRQQISDISGKLVDVSTTLWEMSQKLDRILLAGEIIQAPDYYPPRTPKTMPEPPETAVTARSFKRMPEPALQPEIVPESTQMRPEPPKPSAVERLLGKDVDQRQKDRAARMAQLEKELADLNAKK